MGTYKDSASRIALLTGVSFIVVGGGGEAARAAVDMVSENQPISLGTDISESPVETTATFEQFDTSLGTLTDVKFIVESSIDGGFDVNTTFDEDVESANVSGDWTVTAGVTVSGGPALEPLLTGAIPRNSVSSWGKAMNPSTCRSRSRSMT